MNEIEGIIVSELSYGETSKIINVLTRDHGIIGIMAKGAKTVKSKLRSVTLKLTYVVFYVTYKENKLYILKGVDVKDSFKNIKMIYLKFNKKMKKKL